MLPGPITYYNVQKLFRIFYGDGKNAASLEYAVEFLGIEKQAGFHRAVNDADYTARIFNRMDKKEAARWYTVDYYQNPKSRKEELHLVYDTYAKDVSREFATREEAMKDREVRTTRCFVCGRPAAKKIRWFSGKNRAYYCLAQCREHGYIRGKIRLKKTDEDKIFAVKTLRLITEEEAGNIRNMKEEMREKRLEELRGVLQSPEDVILCRIIEERVFGKYGRAGEEYEKVVKQIVEKMKDEKTRRSVEMGELLICELEKSCVASL